MNSEKLGKRIKEARLAKKMTQSELVGTFITRNMLSRIESGNACPSVKTLEYLAARLELPPGSLMAAADSDGSNTNSDILLEAKRLYSNNSFLSAKEKAELLTDTEYSDEAAAVLARCCLELAKSAIENKEYSAAVSLAKSAMSYADEGIYKSREISVEAMLLLNETASKAIS